MRVIVLSDAHQPQGTIGPLAIVDGVLLDARIVPIAQSASRGPSTS